MDETKVKLSRHQILLHEGDFDKIKNIYGRQATAIIRALVRRFVKDKIEADSTTP